jgi:hypothetical protein
LTIIIIIRMPFDGASCRCQASLVAPGEALVTLTFFGNRRIHKLVRLEEYLALPDNTLEDIIYTEVSR